RLAAALEPAGAGARPGDDVPRDVGDGDDGVVEGALDVHHAVEDVLLALPLDALLGGARSRRGSGGVGCGGCGGGRVCFWRFDLSSVLNRVTPGWWSGRWPSAG